jgi:ketosteroid isomerase-like protein
MNPLTDVKTNPNPGPESNLKARMQRIEDNLQMMHAYFDMLFTKDLNPMLDMFDQDIEWLIVPTGDTIKGKDEIVKLAANYWAASPGRVKTLVNLFASEEYASLEYRTAGMLTNQADFPSIKFEPTGKRYDFLCSFVFHIKNGKIDRVHEYFDMETVKRQLGTVDTQHDTESFAQKFKKIYLGDDLDGFMQLVDKDAVWSFMATGEKFSGVDQIRMLAEKAMAGRIHTQDLHMELTNMFCGEEQMCIEYLHRAIMPEKATLAGAPPAGTEIAVPICLTMHIKNGKFDKVDEYLDLATMSGVKQHLFSDAKPNPVPGIDLAQAVTAAMTSDDVESMVNLFAPDGEWAIMATGESFRGHDQIRQLATRSVAARDHTDGLGIKPTNVFTNAEGTKLCWEYVHTGVVTDKWPASSHKVAPGTKFDLPIILMCDIRQGKLVKIREYFDLLTLLEPDTPHRLYS